MIFRIPHDYLGEEVVKKDNLWLILIERKTV